MTSVEAQDENDNINPENGRNKQKKEAIILGVYIHCEGCANEVIKHLRGFQGVEGVEVDAENHKVTVKGENADPTKVIERLRKKSGKHVELISPKPKKEKQKKEEKPPEVDLFVVTLRIYMHCEGCAKDVKQCILKMEGVQTVDPDAEKHTVSVKGSMDPKKLVEFINKRGGRHAEIVKQINIKKNAKQENKNAQNQEQKYKKDNRKDSETHHQLVFEPQLFSDENPNACSLM